MTGDVVGIGRCKESHHRSNLLRLCGPLRGDQVCQCLSLGLIEFAGHIGIDETGGNCIDLNSYNFV